MSLTVGEANEEEPRRLPLNSGMVCFSAFFFSLRCGAHEFSAKQTFPHLELESGATPSGSALLLMQLLCVCSANPAASPLFVCGSLPLPSQISERAHPQPAIAKNKTKEITSKPPSPTYILLIIIILMSEAAETGSIPL